MNPRSQIPQGLKTASPKGPTPFANRFNLPAGGQIGVVAVSGGADSVALLRALHAFRIPLVVAHLDHRLRGAASDADAAFVRQLAESLELPFVWESVDALAEADGENLEGAARRMRYEFFDRTAVRCGAGWVATGHTADDQAETVIQRLLRGTGIRGLAGITDGRDGLLKASRVPLLRPLLRVERREIVDYLQSLDQPWREDASNADSKFTRNRIRREILPLLKTVSPALVPLLGGLAEQATEVQSLLDELAESALEEVLVNGGERGTVRVLRLAAVPANDLIRREMFRLLWRNANWPLDGMTRGHWKRLSALCDGTERSEHFPGRIRVERQAKTIVIETG